MDAKVIAIIIGMMLVTYIPRMLPMAVLSRVNIPQGLLNWLGYVPVAVLSALLAPELLLKNGHLSINLSNTYLLAAIPCVLAGVYTKNIFITVITGMVTVVLLNNFL
ncbi:branched-chain amino acid transport [Desulfotomaculum nigrificans CO-1-SRB]|uniref:Branched-chain amino acid transport n=1 Tax=Desulfotomaculum nigrificans (strain DSM 14880 / VKM B-2319 / CO-1-SRB) TaxID=868595 RepID=F6B8J4_DESCC|nr:AzlD domain-containing protein [Desulfotomaculum nigrificans]AEF93566.1 branched-chain amino acid transport [Desulfotomaculum nigrificans CO-1-SRB]